MENSSGQALRPQHIAALVSAVQECAYEELQQLSWMDLSAPSELCLRLTETHIPDFWRERMPGERWACVVQSMAIMALAGKVHEPGAALGRVLGESLPVSAEPRFWRLLEARGEEFDNSVRHIVRTLTEAGRAVDWMDIVRLCLLQDDATLREEYCRVVAHDFCIAQYIREKEECGAA